jgi:hypothetical protein
MKILYCLALIVLTSACSPNYAAYNSAPTTNYRVRLSPDDETKFLDAVDKFARQEGYRRYSAAPYSYTYAETSNLMIVVKMMAGADTFRVRFYARGHGPTDEDVRAVAARAVDFIRTETAGAASLVEMEQ